MLVRVIHNEEYIIRSSEIKEIYRGRQACSV